MDVYHRHIWYPQRPEEGVNALELELQAGVRQPMGAGNQEEEESSLCVLRAFSSSLSVMFFSLQCFFPRAEFFESEWSWALSFTDLNFGVSSRKTSLANRRFPAALRWCLILYRGLWPLCRCFGGAKQLCLCLGLAFHIWIFFYFLAVLLYKNKQTNKKLLALLHGPVSELCLLYALFHTVLITAPVKCLVVGECPPYFSTALSCFRTLLFALRSLPSPHKLYDQLFISTKWLTWVLRLHWLASQIWNIIRSS